MLPDLTGWAIFAKIAQHGSFARAASELGLSNATVSKAVSRLEARLGEKLIHRTSRRLSLTEAGRVLSVRAANILAEAEAAEAEAAQQAHAPRGVIRLAAPMSFGLRQVAPLLPDFLSAHPGVSIDLRLDDRRVDLVADGIDVALRIAALDDSSFKVRRLCPVERWVVASPDFVQRHGHPAHPADLAAIPCLVYTLLSSGDRWTFVRGGERVSVQASGPLRANNGDAFASALAAGLGAALQPDFMVRDAVAEGRLVRLLDDWSAPPLALNLLTPAGGPRPARVTALIDHLAAGLSRR